MKTLEETDILRIMREEWDRKISSLVTERKQKHGDKKKQPKKSKHVDLDIKVKVDDQVKSVISPELRVMHSPSRIKYTVDAVTPRELILREPEGEKFMVDTNTLEDEYEVG